MQFIKLFLFLSFALFFLPFSSLNAQNVVTNENGEKIIVYPDGSWKYYEEKLTTDTIQMSETAQSIQEEVMEISATDRKESSKKKNRGKIKKEKKKRNNKKQQSTKEQIVINGKDAQLLQYAQNNETIASKEVERIEEQIQEASFNRIFIEKELEDANLSGEATLDDLMDIEQRLKVARNNERKIKAELSEAKKNQKQWNKVVNLSASKRAKVLADVELSPEQTPEAEITSDELPQTADAWQDTEVAERAPTQANIPAPRPRKNRRKLMPYRKNEDVLFNPPRAQSCQFTFDGTDEFSGKKRRELAPQLFFTYTSDRLRPYFKDREYITCMAHLTALSGGLKYLTLEFSIASPNAQREFGLLEKGSPISIKFLDGSTIKLINTKTDMGTPDPVTKVVTYRGQYSINSGAEKLLKKNEIDLVRVVWSQGYEDYEVYYMDFISDQFQCLE